MKDYWRIGEQNFESIRANCYDFANACFKLVQLIEQEKKVYDAIEIMNHAPKILRILDAIQHETDLRKFKTGVGQAITEIQASMLALLNIYRESVYKKEIDILVKMGQDLKDILAKFMDI